MFLLEGHRSAVRALAYRGDSRELVSGGEDGRILLWSFPIDDGPRELLQTNVRANNDDTIEAIRVAAADSIYAAEASGTLIRIRCDGPARIDQLDTQPINVRCLVDYRGGSKPVLLTSAWNNLYQFRDPETLQVVEETPTLHYIRSLAVSGDRTVALIAGHNGLVRRLSPAGWSEGRFQIGDQHVQLITCDPLVRFIALADLSGKLWLYRTGPPLPELERTMKHPSPVLGMAFTPDGRRLVSGGADGTVRVWDTHSGEQLHVFEWHRKWVTCLAMSPDGTTVATGSEDATIAVWDMPD